MTEHGPINVLVAYDEENTREELARILEEEGMKVFTVGDSFACIKVLKKEPVDIVLLDMRLQGQSGLTVLRQATEINDRVLVIALTCCATVETAVAAIKKGAYDLIIKPVKPDQMLVTVDRAIERLRLTREAEMLAAQRRQTLEDLGTEQSRLRSTLELLPSGVLVTDGAGEVVLLNPACYHHLELNPNEYPGEAIEAYVSDGGLCGLVMDISKGKYRPTDEIPTCEFAMGENKFLMARGMPVVGESGECLGAVVNIMDITELKLLDRLRNEFISKVTHELRSPLSTIHEQIAMVLKDMVEKEMKEDRHMLQRAKEKTKGLISLIGDLLDVFRIEAGYVCRIPKALDLAELLTCIVEFLGTRAKGKGQRLTVSFQEQTLPKIKADPMAIESIFGNLITNAVNYTPEGGRIEVLVDTLPDHIRVRVKDNGPGIEKEELGKIFERFYRVKNERTRHIEGTGLGLSIVKKLLDKLEGRIEVESRVGKGSVFTVLLPLTLAGKPEREEKPESGEMDRPEKIY